LQQGQTIEHNLGIQPHLGDRLFVLDPPSGQLGQGLVVWLNDEPPELVGTDLLDALVRQLPVVHEALPVRWLWATDPSPCQRQVPKLQVAWYEFLHCLSIVAWIVSF
jgi:hypothetical protein